MTFLPSVIRAEYRGGHRIQVTFNDDSEKTIDFRQWLDGPVFEPLKDPDYFRRFFLDGGTVAWPNGADIAPETLYEYRRAGQRPTRRLKQTGPLKRGSLGHRGPPAAASSFADQDGFYPGQPEHELGSMGHQRSPLSTTTCWHVYDESIL